MVLEATESDYEVARWFLQRPLEAGAFSDSLKPGERDLLDLIERKFGDGDLFSTADLRGASPAHNRQTLRRYLGTLRRREHIALEETGRGRAPAKYRFLESDQQDSVMLPTLQVSEIPPRMSA